MISYKVRSVVGARLAPVYYFQQKLLDPPLVKYRLKSLLITGTEHKKRFLKK